MQEEVKRFLRVWVEVFNCSILSFNNEIALVPKNARKNGGNVTGDLGKRPDSGVPTSQVWPLSPKTKWKKQERN